MNVFFHNNQLRIKYILDDLYWSMNKNVKLEMIHGDFEQKNIYDKNLNKCRYT